MSRAGNKHSPGHRTRTCSPNRNRRQASQGGHPARLSRLVSHFLSSPHPVPIRKVAAKLKRKGNSSLRNIEGCELRSGTPTAECHRLKAAATRSFPSWIQDIDASASLAACGRGSNSNALIAGHGFLGPPQSSKYTAMRASARLASLTGARLSAGTAVFARSDATRSIRAPAAKHPESSVRGRPTASRFPALSLTPLRHLLRFRELHHAAVPVAWPSADGLAALSTPKVSFAT